MADNILIVDQTTTNRIIISAHLRSAGLKASSFATLSDLLSSDNSLKTRLLIIDSNALASADYDILRRKLRAINGSYSVISTIAKDRADLRLAALTSGADCVFAPPFDPGLLRAELRKIQRVHALEDDLFPNRARGNMIGFAENGRPPLVPTAGRILILSPTDDLAASMRRLTRAQVQVMAPDLPLRAPNTRPPADVVIIDQRVARSDTDGLFRMMAEMRAHETTRQVMQVLLFERHQNHQASMALDMGADDVLVGQYSPDEVAHRAGRVLRRKKNNEAFRAKVRDGLRAAITDPLTGLSNRRFALPKLEQMSREYPCLAVLTLDIDHFKRINDTYGHAVGDEVLTELAQRLRAASKPEDLIARLGGEEFLVVRPVRDTLQATQMANDMCDVIRATPIALRNRPDGVMITASVGVALHHGPIKDARASERVLDIADRALYASKHAGRDRYTVAQFAA